MPRKKQPQSVSRGIVVDKSFSLTPTVAGRVRTDIDGTDEAELVLYCESTENSDALIGKIEGIGALRVLNAELADFLAKVDSKGVH